MSELLTRGQVAELIGRHRRRIPEWAARHSIRRRRDERGWWLYPADEVRAAAVPPVRPVPGALRLARFIRNPLNH